MNFRYHLMGLAGSLMLMGAPLPSAAQEFPDRPIQIIVPLSPGGLSDLSIRKLEPELSKALGQPVVIENRAGAGATVGTAAAKQAAPDGYTLVLAAASSFSINPHLRKELAYDPRKDFEPVCLIGGAPTVLAAHPSLGVRSIPELIEKAKLERIAFASAGAGTPSHLSQELLKSRVDVDFVHVPYRGTAQAVTDTVAGHTQVLFESPGPLLPAIHAGQLVPLGTFSPRRLPALPDVPTFAELGYDHMELIGWIGLAAPAGVPSEAIDKLATACQAAVENPEFQKFADEQGLLVFFAPPAEFRERIDAELAKWGDLVRLSGLQPE